MRIRRSTMLADPSARRAKSARRVPLQPQSCRAAHRRKLHAEATRGVVKLELYRLARRDGDSVCVTYWMNRLQNIESEKPLFVTLNPPRPPRAGTLLHSEVYDHPIFDAQGDGRSAQAVAAAGRAEYLVLRRVFRRGLSRGRLAGRARRRRATRRRATAVAGAKRVRTHRPYGKTDRGERRRSCRHDGSVRRSTSAR